MENIGVINICDDGSTGKIAVGIYKNFVDNGYNVLFCYGRGKRTNNKSFFKFNYDIEVYFHYFLAKLTGRQCIGSRMATKRLIRRLKEEKIDTIYALNLHGYYLNEELFFDYISKNKIRFVYIMADESAFLGKCMYHNECYNYKNRCVDCPLTKGISKIIQPKNAEIAYKIKEHYYPQIEKCCFVAPEFVIEKAKTAPLLYNKKLRILDEAIDTSFYSPQKSKSDILRDELGIAHEKIIIVCVAPLSYERKGVKYFIEAARLLEKNEDFVFLHVGYDKPNNSELPKNLKTFPPIYDQERLTLFYSLADLFVFPSINDTMPNSCLEALSSGTPLLCFNISGMPYIMDETVGTLVEPCNVEQLVAVILKTKKKTEAIVERCRSYALRRFDNKSYAEKLIEIGESLV